MEDINTYEINEHDLKNFEQEYPKIYRDCVRFYNHGIHGIIGERKNGDLWLFSCYDCTVRQLPEDPDDMTKEESKVEFGYRLRNWILHKGKNQKWLAEATGIDPHLISEYVNGRSMPNVYNADRMAKALGCFVDDFLYKGKWY